MTPAFETKQVILSGTRVAGVRFCDEATALQSIRITYSAMSVEIHSEKKPGYKLIIVYEKREDGSLGKQIGVFRIAPVHDIPYYDKPEHL